MKIRQLILGIEVPNDFDYKSLTKIEVQEIFRDVDFPLEPMHHQYVSLVFAADKNRLSYLLDVGTGKTLLALYDAKLWGCKKTLVVCPSSAFGSWRRDLKKNTDFTYSFVVGSGRSRKCQLKKKKDVYVITYPGLKTVYAKYPKYKGEGWKVQDDSFIHNFDCIILDEDHRCGNHDSLQSEICYQLSRRAKYVIGMTGTLIDSDKSFLDLHNVYKVIDLGKSLGPNFFAYRNRYFEKEICGKKFGNKWVEWHLKPGAREEILDRIAGISISYDREECFELPPKQEIIRYILPSKEFLKIQKDIVDNKSIKSSKGKVLIKKSMISKPHVMRELPSGFFYYGEDKKVFSLKVNSKAEALVDFLDDTKSKVLVFYWYTEERNIIKKALRKADISFCSAFGGQTEIEREDEIARFSDDSSTKVLLSQVTVGNEGYDAFVANTVVFFSPLSSPKKRKQCIGRIYRKGQKRKCLIVDFVLEDSFEEHVIVNRSVRFKLVREAEAYMRTFHTSSEVEEE